MHEVRLLVLSNDVLLRELIRRHLESTARFVVTAADHAQATHLAELFRPDLVLLEDDSTPPVVGAVKDLHAIAPNARIVVLSRFDHPHFVEQLIRLGVRGRLDRTCSN